MVAELVSAQLTVMNYLTAFKSIRKPQNCFDVDGDKILLLASPLNAASRVVPNYLPSHFRLLCNYLLSTRK